MNLTQSEENELAFQIKELVQQLNGKMGLAAKNGLKVEVDLQQLRTAEFTMPVVQVLVWKTVG